MRQMLKGKAASWMLLAALAGCGPDGEYQLGGEGGESDLDHDDVAEVAEELGVSSPVPGRGITTPFGKPGKFWAAGYHTGDDYACPTGSAAVATAAGTVVFAGRGGWGSAYGIHVIVDTGPIRHLYAHLSKESVSVGQSVARGQRLGSTGATGNVTGPHLHYEERVSPYGYFNHRRPQFNKQSVSGGGGGGSGGTVSGGYKNWAYGQESSDVEGLQRALVLAGCDVPGKYTNYYGENTKAAVACFQRKQGWSGADADGKVGPVTAQRLWLTGSVTVSKLRYGVKDSDSVRMLQQRLNEVRNTMMPITGSYSPTLRDAVKAWQRSIGDSGSGADGNMGPLQAKKLFPSGRYDVN